MEHGHHKEKYEYMSGFGNNFETEVRKRDRLILSMKLT